jgi:hemolysin activation/secretion protein
MLLSAMMAQPASAQLPPGIPQPPSPAQIVPQGSPIPRILPPSSVPVGPSLTAPPPAAVPPANAGAEVTIRDVAMDGVTAYRPADLLAGTGITPGRMTVGDIEKARQGILDRYRGDDYLLTTVVATVDPQGRLRFVVTEGRIADVKLDGDIGPAGTQVLRFLNRLKEVRPIDTATLERYLLLAQDVPGVSLRAVLRPSADEPGALSLVAQVQRAAVSGLFTADNRASTFTGPEQALAVLGLNSFSEYGEKTEISLYRTFNNTQLFGQAATELFIGSDGLKLRVYAGSGTADPSGALRQQNYHGVTITGGFSVSYPIIRSRQQTLSVAGYFDVLESHIDTGFAPNVALNSRDNLRILRLGADYALQDQIFGGERSAINAASLRVSRGVPILGSSRQGDPMAGRLPQNVDFTKVALELQRTQTLFGLGDAGNVALQVTVAGQYSGDVLPAAEKFFLGGQRFNRGYYSGQITGDTALVASFELQYNTGFTTDFFGTPLEIGSQFYGFYDYGETWESQRRDANHRLNSAGGGVRLSVTRFTEFDIEGVARMNRQPLGAAASPIRLRSQAVYWRVVTRF